MNPENPQLINPNLAPTMPSPPSPSPSDPYNPTDPIDPTSLTGPTNLTGSTDQAGPTNQADHSKKKIWRIVSYLITAAFFFILGILVSGLINSIQYNSDTGPSSGGLYKPMIYLYPEQETSVSVTLGHPEKLTTTYPAYNSGWQVIASPDGTLRNMRDQTNRESSSQYNRESHGQPTSQATREYYGLYWEGSSNPATMKQDGFVVPGNQTASFLEEKLALLGLTDREANEFIIYWLPKLEHNPYNYIRFETMDEINSYMPLTISPTPDSIIRIIMDFKPLNEPIEVTEQSLTTPERTGFTVVEWGGTEIGEGVVH